MNSVNVYRKCGTRARVFQKHLVRENDIRMMFSLVRENDIRMMFSLVRENSKNDIRQRP